MIQEKETATTRYRNDRHKAVANFLFTYSNVTSRLQKMLSEHQLSLQQFNILRILQRRHPQPSCNCTIRKQMLDARSDITRIVDRLVKEGLAVRESCSNDRRKVNITITKKGLDLLTRLDYLNDKMDGIMACLTDGQVAELNRLLDKIRNHS
ncbi:MAG: MarR family transcriptional regulator [Balneolaceae bacterium]|nr:MAG: MarR family transcriptional regulator [Balneolaceae bacterium]